MIRNSARLFIFALFAALCWTAAPVRAQAVDVDQGYLDRFELTDGRLIDVGALGGGLDGDPNTHKIFVPAQTPGSPPWPPIHNPSDGRLTGTVHGKFRVVFLTDRNTDGFINGGDLDNAFDVTWGLVGFDKDQGPSSAFFRLNSNPGPEGSIPPWGNPASVNFPPTPGGTASVWKIAACDGTGFNPGSGSGICDDFAIPASSPFTGFVDYTFPISIPGANDFTPGLDISPANWIITALVGNTADAAGGVISFGRTALYDPQLAVTESNSDLFGPATLLNFPGGQANIPKANLLASVQIRVTPEPMTMALLGFGAILVLRSRSRRRVP